MAWGVGDRIIAGCSSLSLTLFFCRCLHPDRLHTLHSVRTHTLMFALDSTPAAAPLMSLTRDTRDGPRHSFD